jgi:hypothetical protein
MALKYSEMMEWSERVPDYSGGTSYFKPSQGTHATRIVDAGNDPAFSGGSELFFRTFIQHSYSGDDAWGNFLCWNYLAESGMEGMLGYLIQNKLIKREDFYKYTELGCPGCNTIDFLVNELKMDGSKVRAILKTQERCLFNLYYCYRMHPPVTSKTKQEDLIEPGIYTWDIASWYMKKVINALAVDSQVDGLSDDDLSSMISHDEGKLLVIIAKGKGATGKNRREYDFQIKGQPSPIYYIQGNEKFLVDTENEEEFNPHNLVALEAKKFKGYQDSINETKAAFEDTLDNVGYEIPGDEPSDNPLDDNYDPEFAERALSKPKGSKATKPGPIATKKHRPDGNAAKLTKAVETKRRPVPPPEPEEVDETDVEDTDVEVEDVPVDPPQRATVNKASKKNSFEEAVPPSPEWEEQKAQVTKKKGKAEQPKGKRNITW